MSKTNKISNTHTGFKPPGFLFGSVDTQFTHVHDCMPNRLYKLERIFSQQVDLKSALNSKDFL